MGLMQRIENDPNSKYVKLKLDYSYGLDKIYDRAFIESKKLEPEFEREYNLSSTSGDLEIHFIRVILMTISLGNEYDPDIISVDTTKCLGIDPGWGSSNFGLCPN